MTRIAIVGAGPAGLSMARLLRERGYGDLTVFERSDTAGGKVRSVFEDDRWHELGACYLTSGYTRVSKWMREAGIDFETLETFQMEDGTPLQEFIYSGEAMRARIHVLRYLLRWMGFHLREQLGWLSDAQYAALAEPFGPWLRGLEAMHRLAQRSTVAMGYGFLDATPALWGLRWNKPSLILTGLRATTREPIQGWQNFWQQLASAFEVHYQHDVRDLARTESGCVLTVCDLATGTERTEHFDQVIWGIPLNTIGRMPSATEDERWMAGHITHTRYCSTLVEVEDWFDEPVDTVAWRQRLLSPSQREAADEPLDRVLVVRRTARKEGRGRQNLYVCYQYIDPKYDPESSAEAMLEGLRTRLSQRLGEDLKEEGATLKRVVSQHIWDYFPRFTAEGIRHGAVNRLRRMQGVDGIWYVGGSTVLESIDHIVDENILIAMQLHHQVTGTNRAFYHLRRSLAAVGRHSW